MQDPFPNMFHYEVVAETRRRSPTPCGDLCGVPYDEDDTMSWVSSDDEDEEVEEFEEDDSSLLDVSLATATDCAEDWSEMCGELWALAVVAPLQDTTASNQQ